MHKTRTRQWPDGRSEVIRVLAPDALTDWTKEDPLAYEKSIVWLEDLRRIPFVRVGMARGVASRRGPLHATGVGRIVGYAKLTPDAPKDPRTNAYVRRFFYVKESDQPSDPPPGAVDARTLVPGSPGQPWRSAVPSPAGSGSDQDRRGA